MLLISTAIFAQEQMDALRFSRNDLFGTARSMSMGGAFGALGGDQTGVSINPAGIAIYRSSEIAGTFGLMRTTATVGDERNHRTSFDMDNIGFVAYMPLRSAAMPFINFGFSMNRQKSFNRRIEGAGVIYHSLLDFAAVQSTVNGLTPAQLNIENPFRSQLWLPTFANDAGLIIHQGGQWLAVNDGGESPFSQFEVSERGNIDNFAFSMGTTINNVLSIGAAVNVKTVSYRFSSFYDEDFTNGWLTLRNALSIDGAGASGRFGIIYRPIHEVRIGVSYHTPTWLSLSQTYSARMDDDMEFYSGEAPGHLETGRFGSDFDLRTPGRWVFSLATVLNNNFILSADYEIMNYRTMEFAGRRNFNAPNKWIQEDFRTTSTVRLGMEYRFTPQFSGRLGYAWMQNPNTDAFRRKANPGIPGSNSIFRVEGDTNFFTAGLGYRFSRTFFVDFALVYKVQTDDLYAFPNWWTDTGFHLVNSTPFELRNTSWRSVLTLGYRF